MADQTEQSWRLERGDSVVAELVLLGFDMPWRLCRVVPTPGSEYATVRSMSDAAEAAIMAGRHEDGVRLLSEIRQPGFRLVPVDGGTAIDDFLLWFDGEGARLRF
ncbi:conserved hypothetical protein [Catenulispora acidiphila DSM 44928]|uniref:Uncharacterized protein n=1 Tax=Catenulispora acidiphila (strain DSM 44928 / JCM 14897 / NBRC 102108 / NRRL B-24433 / ID139908) TaxID=479433 RepID=C7QJW2_CATAD|nr:hypothetical protein [Catenulispora acidiphila]ACU73200.1 conserved hypothetical protein [Catenulispora acidiphila DSM 44928]